MSPFFIEQLEPANLLALHRASDALCAFHKDCEISKKNFDDCAGRTETSLALIMQRKDLGMELGTASVGSRISSIPASGQQLVRGTQ